MNEVTIVNNIKKEFYNMVLQFYNDYSVNKTKISKDIYVKVLDLYKKINKCKNIDQIRECLSSIQDELKSLKQIYNAKADEYEKLDKKAMAQEASALREEIKDIAKIAQALNDTYSSTKAMISRMTKASRKIKPSTQETPKVTSVEENKRVVNVDGVDFNIPTINELQSLTNQIVSEKENLAKIDPMSKEAIALRKKVNDLCEQRMKIVTDLFGNDGINYIRNVESLETRHANFTPQEVEKPIVMEHDKYLDELENVLQVLADLKFYRASSKYLGVAANASNVEKLEAYKKVYAKYMGQYLSMVSSLHKTSNPVIYSQGDQVITSSNLLSLFDLYNLRGNYQNFKDRHKNGKIGNEAISKELYANALDKIEGYMSSFKALCSEMIKKNGNKVTIKPSISSKEDLRFEIDQKMADLYKIITKKQQAKSM